MTTPPVLFHVGYHKTATTWMQRRLFQPRYGFAPLASHTEIMERIVRPHGLVFDPAPMQALMAERQAEAETRSGPGLVPVVSSEILSAHPFQGGHGSDVYAERIARIAPGARILVSIRSQPRILPSVYTQYLLRGGTMPHDRFFAGTRVPGFFGFDAVHFEYHRLVARYQQLFGADHVYVLTQEALKADMNAAAADLAHWAGVPAFAGLQDSDRVVQTPSYPEHALPVLRRINHVQASVLNPTPIIALGKTPKGMYRGAGWLLRRPPFSSLFGTRKPVSDYVKRHFAGRFDDSNRALAGIVTHPIDLSAYDGVQPGDR